MDRYTDKRAEDGFAPGKVFAVNCMEDGAEIVRLNGVISELKAVNHTLSESYHKSQGRCRDLERLVRDAEILLGGRADVPQFDWAKERKKWLSEKERILK